MLALQQVPKGTLQCLHPWYIHKLLIKGVMQIAIPSS
jgi:hypothetical protein